MPPTSCRAPNTSQSSTPGFDLVTSMSPMVRRMAKGSLTPDSISRMPASRFGMGVRRTTSNTTAASVEATTAPMMRAVSHPVSNRSCTPAATTPALTRTPTLARTKPGTPDSRKTDGLVVRPPSKRMIIRAMTLMSLTIAMSLTSTNPRTSLPKRMPIPSERRAAGTLSRSDAPTMRTPMTMSPAATSRMLSTGRCSTVTV